MQTPRGQVIKNCNNPNKIKHTDCASLSMNGYEPYCDHCEAVWSRFWSWWFKNKSK